MPSTAAYKKLETWRVAMDLVERCYEVTRDFPRDELYGLTSQLRRAAVSIPSNIAEGYSRHGTRVYAYHVSIALGSYGELETCVEIASRLGLLGASARETLEPQLGLVGRLLYGLYASLERKLRQGSVVAR